MLRRASSIITPILSESAIFIIGHRNGFCHCYALKAQEILANFCKLMFNGIVSFLLITVGVLEALLYLLMVIRYGNLKIGAYYFLSFLWLSVMLQVCVHIWNF